MQRLFKENNHRLFTDSIYLYEDTQHLVLNNNEFDGYANPYMLLQFIFPSKWENRNYSSLNHDLSENIFSFGSSESHSSSSVVVSFTNTTNDTTQDSKSEDVAAVEEEPTIESTNTTTTSATPSRLFSSSLNRSVPSGFSFGSSSRWSKTEREGGFTCSFSLCPIS
ncbi:hypothetical protein FDP41_009623 [Naegleria fowleri]|uniref:Uncharacterized protein n=1 Tax=Naegleria fowleri TaxID=5763 RepID=A0A6A5AZV2_NAEFO|nr:uncharacterized protein FDP41_009623 [Naegleria fowleri]KAF0971927.1 hypothetical protein FDP41_009623 [Naegleria fowleri]